MPSIEVFRTALKSQLNRAEQKGAASVEINSGVFHREVGGYPGKKHNMPSCCNVMRQEIRAGDEVLSSPPKGRGASLTIRYRLPRAR